MRMLFGALVVCLLGAGSAEEEAKKLQGTWRVTHAVDDGEEDAARKGLILAFVGDRILTYEDGETHEVFAFTLQPGEDPKRIDFRVIDKKFKGRIDRGIYRLDGKKLEICIQVDPKADRPTMFAAKKGSKLHLVTLEKVK
ncbi:MAG: TIGR03067 domain-containing protein [Gemmataceae bacterium]